MNPQLYATYTPQQQQQHVYGGTHVGSLGPYATQGGMIAPAVGSILPPLHAWVPPSSQELQFYDSLFAHVDEQGLNAIGGHQAVAFLTRSHLDKTLLREIWNIADSQQKSTLSRNEFYVALRLISMAQHRDQVSLQRFYHLAAMPYPLPMMEGVPPPQMAAQVSTLTHVQQNDFGLVHHHTQPMNSKAGYALTADEKSKYHAVFQQYDTDHDGFLMGPEAVALFRMSGLDRDVLRDVWTMADVTQDSKLSVQEFYMAMHLIVCLSKRGLPMPSTLPRELSDTAFGTNEASPVVSAQSLGSLVAGSPPKNGQQQASASPPKSSEVSTFDPLAPAKDVPVQGSPSPTARSSHEDSDVGTRNSQFRAFGSPPKNGQQQASGSPPKSSEVSTFDPLAPAKDVSAQSSPSPTARSSQENFFKNIDIAKGNSQLEGFGGPVAPVPPGSSHGGSPMRAEQHDFKGFSASQISRTASASSIDSMSSFIGMTPAPQQSTHELRTVNLGAQVHSALDEMSFGGQASTTSPKKPFTIDEEVKNLVSQLDRQNRELVQSIASVERKQSAIESISERLRDLDELRHELVTLVMKREDMRVICASTTSNLAEEQTRGVVEQSLRGLVEKQKLLVYQLQVEIARHESELDEATLSAKLQQQLSFGSRSPSPPPSAHNYLGAMGGRTFAFNGAPFESSVTVSTTPSVYTFSPGTTGSNVFNAFGDFGSVPRPIASFNPSSAGAVPMSSGLLFPPTQSANGSDRFDIFGDFAAPPPPDARSTSGKPYPNTAASLSAGQATSPYPPSSSSVIEDDGFFGFNNLEAVPSPAAAAFAREVVASRSSLDLGLRPSSSDITSPSCSSTFTRKKSFSVFDAFVAVAENLISPPAAPGKDKFSVFGTSASNATGNSHAPTSSRTASRETCNSAKKDSPFFPAAVGDNDFNGFSDFNTAPAVANNSGMVFASGQPVGASSNHHASPAVPDFRNPNAAATRPEPSKTIGFYGSSLLSRAAADSRRSDTPITADEPVKVTTNCSSGICEDECFHSSQSIQHLLDNNKKWREDLVKRDASIFDRTAVGQHPPYLWIGCSDSRVPAEEVTGLEPGEMFCHRNVANLVVTNDINVISVVQYAVESLKVKHIIVCGHYGCGGVKAAMENNHVGILDTWLRTVRDVYRNHKKELDALPDDETRYRRTVELNVQQQCLNIYKMNVIQHRVGRSDEPNIHGLVYDIRTGLLKELKIDTSGYFCKLVGDDSLHAFPDGEPIMSLAHRRRNAILDLGDGLESEPNLVRTGYMARMLKHESDLFTPEEVDEAIGAVTSQMEDPQSSFINLNDLIAYFKPKKHKGATK